MERFDFHLTDFLCRSAGVPGGVLSWVYPLAALLAIWLVSYICTAMFRFMVMPAVQKLTARTKSKWDDYLLDKRVMRAFRRIIPPVVWYVLLPFAFSGNGGMLPLLLKVCSIYLVVASLVFVSVFLRSLYEASSEHHTLRNHPLKSIYQMSNLVVVVVGVILVVSIVVDKSAGAVLAGLGASAAIIMLIFKDTILGLVAGVQLTANDMLRPGDWITMEKYGANGLVREVTLTTVKVQNFDNTITTIPPYLLVSDSFQNWRGMKESGGRRMKMYVNIDVNTVHACSDDELGHYVDKGYLSRDVLAGLGKSPVNTLLYRDFMVAYLRNHPDVNNDMMIMVRMLQPTPYGLPVEFYCFSVFTSWPDFEKFQSGVLDYAIVMAGEFGLKVFQRPGSNSPSPTLPREGERK